MSTEQNVTGHKALHNDNDYNGKVQSVFHIRCCLVESASTKKRESKSLILYLATRLRSTTPLFMVASKGHFGYVSEKCII